MNQGGPFSLDRSDPPSRNGAARRSANRLTILLAYISDPRLTGLRVLNEDISEFDPRADATIRLENKRLNEGLEAIKVMIGKARVTARLKHVGLSVLEDIERQMLAAQSVESTVKTTDSIDPS